MDQQLDYLRVKDKLSDRYWRLNNLYYIKDKEGKKVKFKLNWAQQNFSDRRHYFNVILKARQLGFTTFSMIYFLDACLFNSNHTAGVIAHTQNDAIDLFDNKIKYAYENLPEWLKEMRPCTSDSARKLAFNNDSQIYTGTSLRSGTLQKLLVSEYGKISAKYPEKAKEIKTGALNTIDSGQQIFIESTAEGKFGEFYDLYAGARKLADLGVDLAPLQPKSFFYPWWKNPLYVEDNPALITSEYKNYFDELSNQDVTLTREQKNWYVFKADQQGDDMSQEFPSTPEEAFQGSMKGAYYTKSMKAVREKGQITSVPYDSRHTVYTWWDLGTADMMSVWFYQYINNRHCMIDYHESNGQGWEFYAMMLKDKGYNYEEHNFPHDGNKRIRGAEVFTDIQMAQECGIRPVHITPRTGNTHKDVVNICAPILANCWFDAEKCAVGIQHLDNYRKKWNKSDAMFMQEHEHNEASHGADSFRTFAVNADRVSLKISGNDIKPFSQSGSSKVGWMGY